MRNNATSALQETYDLVVVGSGTAGSAAAARAALLGARVAILEKLPEPGGSGALAVGMFWTAPTIEAYRRRVPGGDIQLATRLVEEFEPTVECIRAAGVHVREEPELDVLGVGVGYPTDVTGLLAHCRRIVLDHAGAVLTGVTVRDLVVDSGRVTGARVDRGDGTAVELRARSVVLATGGYQGDTAELARTIAPAAAGMPLRANPGSTGDGLRLARQVGAADRDLDAGFYGHLVPWPLSSWTSSDFVPYSQYYSAHTVLLDTQGRRFVDEHLGDERTNQDLLHRPGARGVLLFDEEVRRTHVHGELFAGLGAVDRLAVARQAGAAYLRADSLHELTDQLHELGVDDAAALRTIEDYTRDIHAGAKSSGGVPLSPHARPPTEPPFHALAVQPSITFTFGGILTDTEGCVLNTEAEAIPGLFAAGADIGGVSAYGYVGGLAPSFITGCWAGSTAARHALRKSPAT